MNKVLKLSYGVSFIILYDILYMNLEHPEHPERI